MIFFANELQNYFCELQNFLRRLFSFKFSREFNPKRLVFFRNSLTFFLEKAEKNKIMVKYKSVRTFFRTFALSNTNDHEENTLV